MKESIKFRNGPLDGQTQQFPKCFGNPNVSWIETPYGTYIKTNDKTQAGFSIYDFRPVRSSNPQNPAHPLNEVQRNRSSPKEVLPLRSDDPSSQDRAD